MTTQQLFFILCYALRLYIAANVVLFAMRLMPPSPWKLVFIDGCNHWASGERRAMQQMLAATKIRGARK